MKRRRRKKYTWSDSLPDDDWTYETKVRVYRILHPGKRIPLGTHLACLIDISVVAATYGSGDYFFVVFRRRRILRTGIWSIA